MARQDRPLWTCPDCERTFANTNQVHTCALLGEVDDHFVGVDDTVRATFDRIHAVIASHGPVEVLSEKTRIAFHARISFVVVVPRRHHLTGHLILAAPAEHDAFTRVTGYSARNLVHEFRLDGPDDIDAGFEQLLAAAYAVGCQEHLD